MFLIRSHLNLNKAQRTFLSNDSTWIATPTAHSAPARTELRLSWFRVPGPHTLPGPEGQSSAGPFRDGEPPQRRVRPWHRPRPPAQSTALPAREQRERPPHPWLQPALTTPRSLRRPRPRGPALAGPRRAWRWGLARGEGRAPRRPATTRDCGALPPCSPQPRTGRPAALPAARARPRSCADTTADLTSAGRVLRRARTGT